MYTQQELKKALGLSAGWPPGVWENIALWRQALAGQLPHNSSAPCQRVAESLISRVAKLVLLELDTSLTDPYLDGEYTRFVKKMPGGLRQAVETGLAQSRYLLYPYVENGRIQVAVRDPGSYIPAAWGEGGQLTAVVLPMFWDKYTLLVHLSFDSGVYSMAYRAFETKGGGGLGRPVELADLAPWAHLQDVQFINAAGPWFVEYVAPSGQALFARALETLRKIDLLEAQAEWEFSSAERAVFAPMGMFRDVGKKQAGRPFDSQVRLEMPQGRERLFVQTGLAPLEVGPVCFEPEIRDQPYRRRRNDLNRELEDHCEVARGTLSDTQVQARTATEIIMAKQVTYTTVRDIQNATQLALEGLARVMGEIGWRYGLCEKGEPVPQFCWQDSVVE